MRPNMPSALPSSKPPWRRTRGWLYPLWGWGLVVIALAAVFSLYTQPEFMRTLADQVWSCF